MVRLSCLVTHAIALKLSEWVDVSTKRLMRDYGQKTEVQL